MNDLSVLDLKEKIENGNDFILLDVRDAHELFISNLEIESIHIPLDDLSTRVDELDGSKEIILMCRSGNRSKSACELLTGKGFQNVFNLKGGINEWAKKIDPSLPVY